MRIIFASLIIVCLLSNCGFSVRNEHIKGSIADAESESSHMLVEDSRDDDYDIDATENLTGLTLFSETEYQIKDNIPPFTFKAYSANENSDYVSELYVFNTKTDAPICNFKISGLWDAPGIPADIYKTEFIDVDFDGYKDIRIFGGSNGNWNIYYIYFIWDSDVGIFIDDPYGLGDLGLPTFDEENQLIYSMVRASAVDHWYYTHQYVEGELVTIEEISDNGVRDLSRDELTKRQILALEPLFDEDRTNFTQFIKKKLDIESMKMVVVEFKFILYDVPDACILAEYAPDSAVGLLLAQYETSADIN